ncbi:MAG: efflux RND transporter periplasmic adaptor subunit [Lentisphaeria bacterium]
MGSYFRKIFVLVLLVAAVAAGVVFQRGRTRATAERQKRAQAAAQAVPVGVDHVVREAVPLEVRTFGTVEAGAAVSLKPQIAGKVAAVHFTEGQSVRKGDVLFTLDPRPQDAALKEAEAQLAKARVEQANAEKEAVRQLALFQKGMSAQDACDQARTTADALAATVRAGEATAETARLLLEYCTLRAPFDGRTGARRVDPGNVVKANETELTTLHQLQPIRIVFSVPQQWLGVLLENQQKAPLMVRAIIPPETAASEAGELSFVDNEVDRVTGAVRLKATFANDRLRLWPGQFIELALTVATEADALVVPAAAVQTGQHGAFVYVVRPDNTVEARPVQVRRHYQEKAVLDAGVSAGDTVVTDGQSKQLAAGVKVAPTAPIPAASAAVPATP